MNEKFLSSILFLLNFTIVAFFNATLQLVLLELNVQLLNAYIS